MTITCQGGSAGVGVEIAERGRQAVAAMLQRGAAQSPESILQPFGQGDIALAAKNEVGMLEPRIGEAEMVEAVIERPACDRHPEMAHLGEIRQPEAAGFMDLPEHDLLYRPMEGAPSPNPTLQGPAHPVAKLRVASQHLFKHGNRAQAGRRLDHWDDLAIPNQRERIRSATSRGALRSDGRRRSFSNR